MVEEIDRFNIRVYGILLNADGELLLSSERRGDFSFTKFPGGGLEFGEGTIDCLKREFNEELGIEIKVKRHFYTTDFFQQSAFRQREQIISIYYCVEADWVENIDNGQKALDTQKDNTHQFYWCALEQLSSDKLTFPIDRKVLALLKSK